MSDMKKLILLVPLGLLASCQGDEPAAQVAPEAQTVTIGAAMDRHTNYAVMAGGTTRSAYTLTQPEAASPLGTYIWASTTSATYPHYNGATGNGSQAAGYVVTKHAYANFYSHSTALDRGGDRGFVFPVNGKVTPEVYFVGLAPAANDIVANDVWKQNSNSDAYFTFHGYEDVMYAPEVSGHYSGDIPELHYYHLLTHLRFVLKCEGATEEAREEVSYAWGKVKTLVLTKQNNGADDTRNRVTIDLSRVATTLTQVEQRSTFSISPGYGSTDGYVSVYTKGSDSYFGQNPTSVVDDATKFVEIPYAEADGEEMAYMLCAPVTATAGSAPLALTDEYTLTLNTEKRSNVSIPIDLMVGPGTYFSGSTMGCEFVVTLTFRFGKVIATSTAMYDWSQLGGQTPIDIEDE